MAATDDHRPPAPQQAQVPEAGQPSLMSLPPRTKLAILGAVLLTLFLASLDCLRPLGLMVSFGQASGMVPPFSINILSAKGSLYLTRPTLQAYAATREELLRRSNELF